MDALFDAVCRAVDPEAVIELSRAALRIPSISGEERAAAEFFVGAMRGLGIPAELQPVPASPMMGASVNAIGRLKGSGGGPSLMFNGHIDHNPTSDGWTKDPFGGTVEDGWLYGFVHMKAADATYILALDAVRRAGIDLAGDVTIGLVCGELRGGMGTQELLRQGGATDYFVLGEPTELEVAFTHTASIVVRLDVLGRTKHFATVNTPDARGVNAVEKAVKVIAALGPSHTPLRARGDGGWLSFRPAPGFEGLPQLNIGPVRAGIGTTHNDTRPALLPDRCTLTVDFRLVPGMSRDTLRADLVRLLDGIAAEDADFRYAIEFAQDFFPLPFDAPRDSAVARSVSAAHRFVNGAAPAESAVLKFAVSDAAWLAQAGIAGVVYGPTGRYLSRPDERCRIDDLVRATKAYACVIADLCARKSARPRAGTAI